MAPQAQRNTQFELEAPLRLSVTAAAEMLLARIANNLGDSFNAALDTLAYELSKHVPIIGLDSRTSAYRAICIEEIQNGRFERGALLLRTNDGGVLSKLTVNTEHFCDFLSTLSQRDFSVAA